MKACLADWRKMTHLGEICLMIDASEGVLYRFAKLIAAKRVITSKHQLQGMPCRSLANSKWGAGLGGIAYVSV
jgi:hypothetical protein